MIYYSSTHKGPREDTIDLLWSDSLKAWWKDDGQVLYGLDSKLHTSPETVLCSALATSPANRPQPLADKQHFTAFCFAPWKNLVFKETRLGSKIWPAMAANGSKGQPPTMTKNHLNHWLPDTLTLPLIPGICLRRKSASEKGSLLWKMDPSSMHCDHHCDQKNRFRKGSAF